MESPKAPKGKFFEKVINPYLAGVLQHPQSIEMREGVLHIRDVEGPKKTGSMEARLEAMEQQVFKCQGMVERGLNANHMMITEFTNKHKIDANDIGKHLSRLYDRIDHLQAQIYDLQNQNCSPPLMVNGTILTLEHVMQRLDAIENKIATVELIEEKELIVNDSSRIGKLEDVITNLGSAFAAVQNTPNLTLKKTVKPVFVPKASGESSNKDENLKMINDHTTYGLSTKDDYT
ncbi:40S ribosomal protein S5-1 [Hordeum vulgare]|nr:40S ribosomal protein S5-1 [Hordeum vulgare]